MADNEWPLEVWTASPPRDTGDVYQRVKGSGQATKKKSQHLRWIASAGNFSPRWMKGGSSAEKCVVRSH